MRGIRLVVLGIFVLVAAARCPAETIGSGAITMRPISTYASGLFRQSAAEIPAHCPQTQRIFMVNAAEGKLDVLDLSDPDDLRRITSLDVAGDVGSGAKAVNSVAIADGLAAVAVESDPVTDPGFVAFYDTGTLEFRKAIPAGALPDMVTFSPDGRWVLVANEGEPNDDYTIDPEGTVTIIDLAQGLDQARVRTVGFRDWNEGGPRAHELPDLMERGLRHFGRVTLTLEPSTSRLATFAEDVEPEWIEVCADSRLAYVCLQEANAVAEIDIVSASVTRIIPLGFKDHGQPGNEIDVSDRDGEIRLRTWPGLYGVYQPDTIRVYAVGGRHYLVTANEGDARLRPDGDDRVPGVVEGAYFSDEATLSEWPLAGSIFEASAGSADLGRLRLVRDLVDRHLDDQGRPTKLFAFGARSFSLFDLETEQQIFDSGSDFERITAELYPRHFNASNHTTTFDQRSRSKGPEPEGIALGAIDGRTYAFIGLERIGGVMIYDISDPQSPAFVGYYNHRNFDVEPQLSDGSSNPEAGDSGVEGLIFIHADQSPDGRHLLITGNETSGTTTAWEVVSNQPTADDGGR